MEVSSQASGMRVLLYQKQCPMLGRLEKRRPVVKRKIQGASNWNSIQDTFIKYLLLK
jgi:hypothetical protein